jgi:hypothetical protein
MLLKDGQLNDANMAAALVVLRLSNRILVEPLM